MRICVLSDVHYKYAPRDSYDRANASLALDFLKQAVGKYDLMVLNGDREYRLHFNESDALSDSQRRYAEQQYSLFRQWYANWTAEHDLA